MRHCIAAMLFVLIAQGLWARDIAIQVMDEQAKKYYQVEVDGEAKVSEAKEAITEKKYLTEDALSRFALFKDGRNLDLTGLMSSYRIGEGDILKIYYEAKDLDQIEKMKDLVSHELKTRFGLDESLLKPRIKDGFKRALILKMKNSKKAESFFQAYERHIMPHLHGDHMNQFRSWAIKHIYFLGSPFEDIYELFKKSELSSELSPSQRKQVFHFLRELAEGEEPLPMAKKREKPSVMILTTSAFGGGHFTVGKAIKTELLETGKYSEVTLIDTREISKERDPFYLLTSGNLHSEDTYDEIYLRDNNPLKADFYWAHLNEFQVRGFPVELMDVLENEIREKNPDVILSCLHHFPELIRLSYALGVPLGIISTDYTFQSKLRYLVPSLNFDLVKITSPTEHRHFFEPLQYALNRTQYPKNQELHATVNEWMNQLDSGYHGMMDDSFPRLDFPIRKNFRVLTEKKEKEKAYRALNLRGGKRKVITLAMGRQGGGALKNFVEEALSWDKDFKDPVDLLVLTGKNRALFGELKEMNKSLKLKNVALRPLGFLNGEQMNQLYNVTDLLLSKPGGATTAEVQRTRVPFLAIDFLPWERGNIEYLERLGLGHSFDKKRSLKEQVLELIGKERVERAGTGDSQWEGQLDELVSLLYEKRKNISPFYENKNEWPFEQLLALLTLLLASFSFGYLALTRKP